MQPGAIARGRILVAAAALVTFVLVPSPASGAPGDLDPTFSGDGKTSTDLSGGNDWAFGVGVLSDGRIVLGGYAWDGAQDNFAAARFKRRGALDPTFSGDGRRIVDLGGLQGWAMALQPDGKILLAGNSSTVVRLKVGGGLDPTFSKDGIRTVDFGASTRLRGIALQPDGKIVVVGRASIGDGDFAVARLKSNGALDTTFSKDGKRLTDLGGVDEALAVAIQSDGKIVVAGQSDGADLDIALARFKPRGALDRTFSRDGKKLTDIEADDFGSALLLEPNGKIVVAGSAGFGVNQDIAVVRYKARGALDKEFGGGDGIVRADPSAGGPDLGQDVIRQPDGRLIVVGSTTNDFAVLRLRPGGAFDGSFGGGDGIVTTDFFGFADTARAVTLQPNGRIVVAGTVQDGASIDFGVARYAA